MKTTEMFNKKRVLGDIVIYKTKEGKTQLEVKLEKDSVWLTQIQISRLFNTERSVITRHIKNIFMSKELEEKSNVQKMHIPLSDKPVKLYNLDTIISVGYRVNSQRATQFRIWATNTLKNYLIHGYILNQKKLEIHTNKLRELQDVIHFIENKSKHQELKDKTSYLISIINEYSDSLSLLYQYDENTFPKLKGQKPEFNLSYNECNRLLVQIKQRLFTKKESTDLFGYEMSNGLISVIGVLYQTFKKKELYPSVSDKASHLLYLIIKDHPFSDGNKRIASLFFIYYLEKNNYLWNKNNEKKINNNTLVALALLIATSDPKEKDIMIQIIKQLLKNE